VTPTVRLSLECECMFVRICECMYVYVDFTPTLALEILPPIFWNFNLQFAVVCETHGRL
jgi:hypothetical protein